MNSRQCLRLLALCCLTSAVQTATTTTRTAAQDSTIANSVDSQEDTTVDSQDAAIQEDETKVTAQQQDRLRFSFNGARWREVIDWLASVGDFALHIDQLPPGSFTYSDNQEYTPDQAISRLNLFLLPQGYAAVRSGRLLTVITLGNPQSLQQLDAMAQVVSFEQLDSMDDHEVVKCFVPLGEIDPNDAITELQLLTLMTSPVILPRSNQLMITETAGKLKRVKQVLTSMGPAEEEAVVKRFNLQHVTAETVLLVAAGHLGIPEGDTQGLDITITTDPAGRALFAFGNPEKIKTLEKLLETIDVPLSDQTQAGNNTLVSHAVQGDNLQTVYDVLQTILSGDSLRLSMQPSTNSIVAFAPVEVHDQIRNTIRELESPGTEFAVIPLNGLDAYFVVSLIEEMFSSKAETDSDRTRDRDRDDSRRSETRPTPTGPRVDADPGRGRLYVRGTKQEIEQIQTLIERLSTEQGTSPSTSRVIPLPPSSRTQILQAAQDWWSDRGRLRFLTNDGPAAADEVIERTFHEQPQHRQVATSDLVAVDQPEPTNAADCVNSQDVRGQIVADGVIIESDNTASLDQLEQYIREQAARARTSAAPPVIYYLKYVTADEAVKMLADLLDGGNSLQVSSEGSLVKGVVSSSGYYGSLVYSRDGMTTVSAGTATIVSDARLNRLIVQGTEADIAMVDRYMKIIDKDDSITDIETYGRTHIIEILHTKAEDVAEVIRNAFPDRIANQDRASANQRGAQPQRRDDQRNEGEEERGEGQRKPPVEKPTRGREPKLAVAVHEPSNSLVITAPDALFEDVRNLVATVDQKSEQVIEVITPTAGVDLETLLRALGSDESAATSSRSSNDRSNERRNDDDRRSNRR